MIGNERLAFTDQMRILTDQRLKTNRLPNQWIQTTDCSWKPLNLFCKVGMLLWWWQRHNCTTTVHLARRFKAWPRQWSDFWGLTRKCSHWSSTALHPWHLESVIALCSSLIWEIFFSVPPILRTSRSWSWRLGNSFRYPLWSRKNSYLRNCKYIISDVT